MKFGPQSLYYNVQISNKAASGWALELATFCASSRWLYDEEYHRHVEAIVAVAVSANGKACYTFSCAMEVEFNFNF